MPSLSHWKRCHRTQWDWLAIKDATFIVERRGGMLIHGAIIAREYGLPCVTGVPEVLRLISTGDEVTVDGYLGIIIIGKQGLTVE